MMMKRRILSPLNALTATMFCMSGSLVLFELLLTRIFGVVLFAQFAHLALLLALLGISVGAVIQHLFPAFLSEEMLERRLAWVCLGQGAAMIVAVVCALHFPLVEQAADGVDNFADRGIEGAELIHRGWFLALLPVLMFPFCFSGLGFAAAFQRRKDSIGRLYGADLLGGGVGAVAFLPALGALAGPDVVFLCAFAAVLAAALLLLSVEARGAARVAIGLAAVLVVVSGVGATGVEILRVRYAAGFSEESVYYTEWTPLTRLALLDGGARVKVLLDNTSASIVVRDEGDLRYMQKQVGRSLVYDLHDPPGRVAVIASSAGPEVAIAQARGFRKIDAIDIAGEIADLVKRKFPDAPLNPFTKKGVRRIKADGRAAVLHSDGEYEIIQMVHANLHSNAGMMASAWNSTLLETKEAFMTYLDRLAEDGTIAFGHGVHTPSLARSAAAALMERGIKSPWRYIAYVKGEDMGQIVLVKRRPWQRSEVKRLQKALAKRGHPEALYWNPREKPDERAIRLFVTGEVLTDDRPYLDRPGLLTNAFKRAFGWGLETKAADRHLGRVYDMLLLQCVFAVAGGVLFLFVPLAFRARAGVRQVPSAHLALIYVACLGFGYLAIETVLIHELVLFIGHPTYAVTVVILSMLLASGLGSVFAGRIPEEKLTRSLTIALCLVVVLGTIQAWLVPDLLKTYALGLPYASRLLLVGALLAPLGFVMGFPFPLGLRLLPSKAAAVVPWAWALNGWMSVVASVVTLLVARNHGYPHASAIALGMYVVALLLARSLRSVGRTVHFVD